MTTTLVERCFESHPQGTRSFASQKTKKTRHNGVGNDLHNRTITLRAKGDASGRLWLSLVQVRKARKALCGIPGCACGGVLGQRPWQGWDEIINCEGYITGAYRNP